MPQHHQLHNGWPLIRTAVAATAILFILGSPAFAYTWLGPFPPIPTGVSSGTVPPVDNPVVPPIFTWPENPPGTGTTNPGTPGSNTPQGTPEPSTIIAGLMGFGTLGLVRAWRKRRTQPLAA